MNGSEQALVALDAAHAHQIEAVVIGGSAGAFEALNVMLPSLSAELHVPVVVLIHLPEEGPNLMVELFAPRCRVKVKEAEALESIAPGTVYFAPCGYHLNVEKDRTFSLSNEAPEHYSRPSIDLLFETAADAYGPHLLALLLSGANEDGARGLKRVRQAGGLAIVQDPISAPVDEMPRKGIEVAQPQYTLSLAALTDLMGGLGRLGALGIKT